MEKVFNVTGSCNPTRHYMVDITGKFEQVKKLVDQSAYFAINRPRQYGKTTMLNTLFRELKKRDVLVVYLSFEGIGDAIFTDERKFCAGFVEMVADALSNTDPQEGRIVVDLGRDVGDLKTLSKFIRAFVERCERKVVVLIDEVDKSSNNQLFLSFLGILREQYLANDKFGAPAFQSVILAGVYDIKSLKLKIREGEETKLNSPWNIAADFNVDMSFSPAEIETMLADYADDKGVDMDRAALAERIHYYTSGYPFLVSKICKNIAEEEADQNPDYDPKHWTLADIDWSFRWLTRPMYQTTNFDDMIKNLENHSDLYGLVRAVSVEGEQVGVAADNPVVNLGITFGILAERGGYAVIANRVYEQRIATYMQSKDELAQLGKRSFAPDIDYVKEDRLNLERILLKFQQFMREHYSDRDASFLEREGRLVFLSFLRPIINGKGFAHKEPVVGPERRIDIAVTFGGREDVIETKIWRGQAYHERGLAQLSDYLDFKNLKTGYLLIFDFSKDRQPKSEWLSFADKRIFAVWV